MRLATLLVGMILPIVAFAQTTQPAEPEDLKALFQPYADRINARVAELPNVPTQAQMDACKRDCDAIGDEFEAIIKPRYVWFCGFTNEKQTHVQWWDLRLQGSAREVAMNRTMGATQARRPLMFTVGYSEPVPAGPGIQTIIKGQVVYCDVFLYVSRDSIKDGATDISTVVAYPVLNAALAAGNKIPMSAKIP